MRVLGYKNMATNDEEEKSKIKELKQRLSDLQTAEDDPEFLTEQTFYRYLVARDWDLDHAEKMLRASVAWRLETKPHHVVCTFCIKTPGFHAMRHVGNDKLNRPVMYASFIQCQTQHNSAEDSIQHMVYLMENAIRSMSRDVYQFVWVMDFTGMKVTSCNPRLAHAVEQIVSNHYPERLGACICVNHGVMFHAFWKAAKLFVPPATAKKVHMQRGHEKIDALFSEFFSEELKHWLFEEIRRNHHHPIASHQKEFWTSHHEHDSRGCPTYVSKYIDTFDVEVYNSDKRIGMYLPHPNIISHKIDG